VQKSHVIIVLQTAKQLLPFQKKSMKGILLCLLIPFSAVAQWPGYFYSFTLKDAAGKLITENDRNYTMTVIRPSKGDIVIDVLMCNDSATIRYYVGGYHGLDETHKLEIVNLNSKEKMQIAFPSSLSGGENKYYRNLFAGALNFKKGVYQVKLPSSDAAWDSLKEIHFCPDYGGVDSYWDISGFQKQ
jgi:hypothetical protein